MTVHASCVQTAVSAVNESWAVRATRKFPLLVCTSAALPTLASGELASTVSVIAPPATLALMVGNSGTELGDVALPPHASIIAATVASEAV